MRDANLEGPGGEIERRRRHRWLTVNIGEPEKDRRTRRETYIREGAATRGRRKANASLFFRVVEQAYSRGATVLLTANFVEPTISQEFLTPWWSWWKVNFFIVNGPRSLFISFSLHGDPPRSEKLSLVNDLIIIIADFDVCTNSSAIKYLQGYSEY